MPDRPEQEHANRAGLALRIADVDKLIDSHEQIARELVLNGEQYVFKGDKDSAEFEAVVSQFVTTTAKLIFFEELRDKIRNENLLDNLDRNLERAKQAEALGEAIAEISPDAVDTKL